MNIPEHIFDKIMSYNSHPVADIMKDAFSAYCSHEKDYSNFSDNYLEYYESNKRIRQWVNKQYQNGNRLGWDDD